MEKAGCEGRGAVTRFGGGDSVNEMCDGLDLNESPPGEQTSKRKVSEMLAEQSQSHNKTRIGIPTIQEQSQWFIDKTKKGQNPTHHRWVVRVKELSDDGYAWRKYGQKVILGAKFQRNYYRCTNRSSHGCLATKTVQRTDQTNDYEIIYKGHHTCGERIDIISTSMGSYCMDKYGVPEELSTAEGYINFGDQGSITFPGCSRILDRSYQVSNIKSSVDVRKEVYTTAITALKESNKPVSSVSKITIANESNKPASNESDKPSSSDSVFIANESNKSASSVSELIANESNKPASSLAEFIADEQPAINSKNATNSFEHTTSLGESDSLGRLKGLNNFLSKTSGKFYRSTECTLQRLLVAFQDVQVKKVGIYGSGGIGKTTVMKAFFSQYEIKRLFDFVLWVNVSRDFSPRKIQNALLQQLPLKVPNLKSEDEVAEILLQALQARSFVLFLDDVWVHIDLLRLGIPILSQGNSCKIVLTTRSRNICQEMEVDRIIKAENLSSHEALQLFRSQVGDVIDSQGIEPYARAIVEECSGLPLTIRVAGRALRMEDNVLSWKLALKEVLLTNNLRILKLGYDRLKAVDMKSCFLYSALLTEGKAISISSLVEYLIEEGFVSGSKSDAHKRGHEVVRHLIEASFLECSDDGSMVKMHDIIRDLALLILLSDAQGLQLLLGRYFMKTSPFDVNNPTFQLPESGERAKFSSSECCPSLLMLKASEGLSESPPEKEWEESRMVFLMDNALSSLPKKPACSKLVTLFLQRNHNLRAIPPSFFEFMSSLQILNLSKTRIKCLPDSLSKLESLQVLILRNCERLRFLPPEIGALKKLLVLDLHGTEIHQLPEQISELRSLTHLQVCFYGSLDQEECVELPSKLISKGVFSNLTELKELSIGVQPGDQRWTESASDLIKEVSCLKLRTLSLHFPEIKNLEYFVKESPAWVDRTLTHFKFVVGRDVKRGVAHVSDDLEHEFNQQDRCLKFADGDNIPESIGKVLSQATAFYLDHHLKAQSLTQFGWANINELKFCIVRDCRQIKAIIKGKNRKGRIYLPFLEHLSIHYAWNLSRIWVGPIPAGSLSMLRRLSVHSCPRLEFILSLSLVSTLLNLEELVIEDCQSLKIIVENQECISIDDDSSDTSENETDSQIQVSPPGETPVLKIKVLKLHYLPRLEGIWSGGGHWPALEYVSVYNCPRLRNLCLNSQVEGTIKEIRAETDWWSDLEWEDSELPAKLQGRFREIHADDIWAKM